MRDAQGNELEPATVTALEIDAAIAARRGTVEEALDLIQRAEWIQDKHMPIRMTPLGIYGVDVEADDKLEALRALAKDLKESPPLFAPAPDPAPPANLPQDLVGYFVDSALALRTWLATEPREKEQAIVFLHYCLDYWEDISKRKRIDNEIEEAEYKDSPRQIEQIRRLQEEMEKYLYMVPAPVSDPAPPPFRALGRIRWIGKTKADLGRVFAILAPLIDCTGADWERHFMSADGGDMTGATDLSNLGMTSKEGAVQALAPAVRKMKPELE